MELFLNSLKGLVSTLTLLTLLLVCAFLCRMLKKRMLAYSILILATVVFLLCSTSYLPYYLAGRIESQYQALNVQAHRRDGDDVLIHVLGGGYTYDHRLPANGQLSQISLGRLVEGIKIFQEVDDSRLVFSGWRVSGPMSMASVMRRAAISLGVDSTRIETLDHAATTADEAAHFARRYGTTHTLILVTDALHMPRAVSFFRAEGMEPVPAPTNFLVRENDDSYWFKWVPSAKNLLLMDRVLREFLGSVKASIL